LRWRPSSPARRRPRFTGSRPLLSHNLGWFRRPSRKQQFAKTDTILLPPCKHQSKSPGVPGSVAPARSWENMVESVELALKFLLWKQSNSPFGEIDSHDSPSEAADFKEILRKRRAICRALRGATVKLLIYNRILGVGDYLSTRRISVLRALRSDLAVASRGMPRRTRTANQNPGSNRSIRNLALAG
jgi:hypothetical protein